jgi:multiple sugar transport system permease protein
MNTKQQVSGSQIGKAPSTRKKNKWKQVLTGWSFILPNFIGFFFFTLIPIICSIAIAFTKWDAFNPPEFIGLANFKTLISDSTFHISLTNTLKYTVVVVPVTMVISLVLATLLNKKIPGVVFLRTAFFFPYITSLVAISAVWSMLFNPKQGPINQFLQHIVANPPGWLASSQWALVVIMFASIWRFMGYYMILYLAGLQGIPRELYEAADMDGASKLRQFFSITIPSLKSTTFLVSVMLTINCFQLFDLVQVMTQGGPGRATNVLVFQIYTEGFTKYNFGYASAIAIVLLVLAVGVTVIQFVWNKRQSRA